MNNKIENWAIFQKRKQNPHSSTCLSKGTQPELGCHFPVPSSYREGNRSTTQPRSYCSKETNGTLKHEENLPALERAKGKPKGTCKTKGTTSHCSLLLFYTSYNYLKRLFKFKLYKHTPEK